MRSKLACGIGVGLLVAVAAGFLGTGAFAGAPPPLLVDFATQHGHPVAGRRFTGLAITNISGLTSRPRPFGPYSVRCDAEIGRTRLHAVATSFGAERNGSVQTVTCSWQIPADAAGKQLHLLNRGGALDGRPVVLIGNATIGGPILSWTVKKR